jgi:hypothetical protein
MLRKIYTTLDHMITPSADLTKEFAELREQVEWAMGSRRPDLLSIYSTLRTMKEQVRAMEDSIDNCCRVVDKEIGRQEARDEALDKERSLMRKMRSGTDLVGSPTGTLPATASRH